MDPPPTSKCRLAGDPATIRQDVAVIGYQGKTSALYSINISPKACIVGKSKVGKAACVETGKISACVSAGVVNAIGDRLSVAGCRNGATGKRSTG